ncbi:nuclear transport factor 2 family protein [Saccharopolyspora sp. NPDC049426]|uniref:nuclear transport factor 2 family protein n=1 Tax=Saccharopolyspora sp. NPDC049426 TaxID=3155652 RepID=UPI003444F108
MRATPNQIENELVGFDEYQIVCKLKARYFFHLDTKQWTRLRALFSDYAVFEGFPFASSGPDAFVAGVAKWLAPMRTVHQGFMPDVQKRDDGVIRARWSMYDYLTWPQDSFVYKGVEIDGMYGIRGYGYYDEEYVRTASGWRISFMRLTRARIDPLVGDYLEPPAYDVPPPDLSWLDGSPE